MGLDAPTGYRGVPFHAMAATGQNPREENEVFRHHGRLK